MRCKITNCFNEKNAFVFCLKLPRSKHGYWMQLWAPQASQLLNVCWNTSNLDFSCCGHFWIGYGFWREGEGLYQAFIHCGIDNPASDWSFWQKLTVSIAVLWTAVSLALLFELPPQEETLPYPYMP